jgi:hypothetical protein
MRLLPVCLLIVFFMNACVSDGPVAVVENVSVQAPAWVGGKDALDGNFHGVGKHSYKNAATGGELILSLAQEEAKTILLAQLKAELKITAVDWVELVLTIEELRFEEKFYKDATENIIEELCDESNIFQEDFWRDRENSEYWVMLTINYDDVSAFMMKKFKVFVEKVFHKGLKELDPALSDEKEALRQEAVLVRAHIALEAAFKELFIRRGGKA